MKSCKFNKCLEIIRKGNPLGLEDIYNAYYEKIKYYACIVLKDAHEAEDIASATLKYILEKIDKIPYVKQPDAWMLKISRNLAINFIRKNSKTLSLDNCPTDILPTQNDDGNFRIMFTDSFLRLTETEQKIVIWHYMYGYRYKEISRILKRPVGTIKSDISIIKSKLEHLQKLL